MSELARPVSDADHALGPPEAPVTLVEYGDYECPHCGRAQPVVRRLIAAMDGDLRFVFRHYPINLGHARAQLAAEAAEAAAGQGRFWEMHERLFAVPDALDPDSLVRHAEELGLDVDRFRAELEDRRHAERVAEDVASGEESGVSWTPTFFVNGKLFGAAPDFEALAAALTSALERSRGARR